MDDLNIEVVSTATKCNVHTIHLVFGSTGRLEPIALLGHGYLAYSGCLLVLLLWIFIPINLQQGHFFILDVIWLCSYLVRSGYLVIFG